MLEGNRKEFDICGITRWQQLGYTGKGIKMAEIENVKADLAVFGDPLHDPFGESATASLNNHGQKVMDVMNQIAPDAELYTLPSGGIYTSATASGTFIEKVIPYIISENIDIVGASLMGVDSAPLREAILAAQKSGTIFLCAAGNEGTREFNKYAIGNVWIAMGAVGWNESMQRIELKPYSSQGAELDFVGFSGLWVNNVINPSAPFLEEGTSFSNPWNCGIAALVQQFFFEKTGRKLNQTQMYQFMKDHVKDLGALGRDDLYGYGLVVLPEPSTIDVNKYLPPLVLTINDAIDVWAQRVVPSTGEKVIGDPNGMKVDFMMGNFRPDRYKAFLIKAAKYAVEKGV